MNDLKKSKLMFDASIDNTLVGKVIVGLINLTLAIKKQWSSRQRKIVKEYKEGLNQSEIARSLGITQQAVSKVLNRSMWREINSAEEKLNSILKEYNGKERRKVY